MTDNLIGNHNLYQCSNNTQEFKKDSARAVMPFYEELMVIKAEIKEECDDFEMSIHDIEFVGVNEDYISSTENNFKKENFEHSKNTKQPSNENVEQTLSKNRLHLKIAEWKNTLKKHILVNQTGEPKLYKCIHCEYTTNHKPHLVIHVRTHTNERPFKCTYKNCKCTSGQEETCKCDPCEYATKREYHLKKHILEIHSEEPKKYKCRVCKYATHRKYHLERHIRTHRNERPFKCTYKNCKCTDEQEASCRCNMCAYAAAEEDNLKRHILIRHSGQPKKYKCAECKYATGIKSYLAQHIRVHSHKLFKCTYKDCNCTVEQKEFCKCYPCIYTATCNKYLNKHILNRHNTKPQSAEAEVTSISHM